MKILEVCLSPALGGLELYFHNCCVQLRNLGHEVISVRLQHSRLHQRGLEQGIQTIVLGARKKWWPFQQAWLLKKIIAEQQPNLIHIHLRDDIPVLAFAKIFSRHPFKLVFTRQMPMPNSKKDPYHRLIYSQIDLYITITERLKQNALDRLTVAPEKIHRLYYGVRPAPPLDPLFLKDFLTLSKPGDFNIGVFSRLEHGKGQHTSIEALNILKNSFKIPARLYIVGDVMVPAYKESLVNRISELGLNEEVAFKGFLKEPMLAMQGMDALILPSRSEAFGLVLIEAMRCGVVVLGVKAGGVPEIIDHEETGMLFEWEDYNQLAGQLARLYQSPDLRKKLSESGKRKADQEFNEELHFQRLETFFKKVIE